MDRTALLKTVYFDHPGKIPVVFHINAACWDRYPREELAKLMLSHPGLFPSGPPPFAVRGEPVPYPAWCIAGVPWTDPWGCVWETATSGFVGSVTHHPLSDIGKVDALIPPNPDETTHWYPVSWEKGKTPSGGSIGFFDCLRSGEIGHGHTFLKLVDILGYEKALYALHDEPQELRLLLAMLEQFNLTLVGRFIEYADVEWLGYAEDLGMQRGPLLSPRLFNRHILPSYRRIMEVAERHGCVIHMHTDGDIRVLADDLLSLPVTVFNIQDQVNTIDWIQHAMKGKVAVDLDIDRQHVTRTGSPDQVREYLGEIVSSLYDPAGGLILTYGLYPDTPIKTVETMMDFLESAAEGGKPWNS